MEQAGNAKIYDVVIAGAGPAGCAAALALKDAGLKVAMLDKETFPRDKVCGDAIPGRAAKTLKSIDPKLGAAFEQFPKKYHTTKTLLAYKNQSLTFNWAGAAYTCARMDFDHFLFTLVKENTGTVIYTGVKVNAVSTTKDNITVSTKEGIFFTAKMLIGADGAQSVIAKQLTNKIIDRDHHVGSVRAYYKNVAGTEDNTTEIYFDKKYLPSYLWIFPLPGNMTNIGFGMLSSEIAKRKINIKNTFYEFIDQNPALAARFKDADLIGELEGFSLPLGSKRIMISGDRFMLAGDAASLIDPISGDGIGNAMLSGKLAAEQAIKSFKNNRFDGSFLKGYDTTLFNALGSELKLHYRAQRTLSKMPFLIDIIFVAGKNKAIRNLINKQM